MYVLMNAESLVRDRLFITGKGGGHKTGGGAIGVLPLKIGGRNKS